MYKGAMVSTAISNDLSAHWEYMQQPNNVLDICFLYR